MQAMPDARQQSFEEIYGAPENFLEIEASLILIQQLHCSVAILALDFSSRRAMLRLSFFLGPQPTNPWHLA
jgi:hypothetical protein